MRLVFATDDFTLYSVGYPGFPIILNKEMEVVEEVLFFLIYHCIHRGRVKSLKSWQAYGQSLYDYFAFLEDNGFHWRNYSYTSDHSILAAYRDWSLSSVGLNPNTVNYRLRIIIRFYEYAYRKTWISSLPFDIETIKVYKAKGFFSHTDASGGMKASPDVMLKTQHVPIKVLSKQQVIQFLEALSNPIQHKSY